MYELGQRLFHFRSTRRFKKLFEMGQFELDENTELFCLKSYPLIYFQTYFLSLFYNLIIKKAKWPIKKICFVILGYSIAFWNEVSVRVKSVLESAGFLSQISPPDRPLCPVWALERIHNLDLRTFSKIVITLFLIKAKLQKKLITKRLIFIARNRSAQFSDLTLQHFSAIYMIFET